MQEVYEQKRKKKAADQKKKLEKSNEWSPAWTHKLEFFQPPPEARKPNSKDIRKYVAAVRCKQCDKTGRAYYFTVDHVLCSARSD